MGWHFNKGGIYFQHLWASSGRFECLCHICAERTNPTHCKDFRDIRNNSEWEFHCFGDAETLLQRTTLLIFKAPNGTAVDEPSKWASQPCRNQRGGYFPAVSSPVFMPRCSCWGRFHAAGGSNAFCPDLWVCKEEDAAVKHWNRTHCATFF